MSEKKEYIERGALVRDLENELLGTSGYAHRQSLCKLIDKLNAIQAADVEPVVRGTWVEMRDPYGDLTAWIHEECGHETNHASNYCSSCGAKMMFVERRM